MKKIVIIILWIFGCYQISFSQLVEEWTMSGGNTLNLDSTGNIYLVSIVHDFRKHYYEFEKYKPDGTFLWKSTYDYTATESGFGGATIMTAVDKMGNIYSTFSATHDGDYADIALLKYSSDGSFCWLQYYNAWEQEGPADITVDSYGNIYITGTSCTVGKYDIVTIKYSTDGLVIWDTLYTSGENFGWETGQAIAVDKEGNVYVAGSTTGFGTQDDFMTVKYSSDGTQLWARNYNGNSGGWLDDWTSDITVDNLGNVYVTGYSEAYTTSAYGLATIKYSPEGEKIWVRRYDYGEDKKEEDSPGEAEVITDLYGNVYVTGRSYGGITTKYDIITIKYSSDGTQLWANRYNNPDNTNDYGCKLVLDNKRNVYVTGKGGEQGFYCDDMVTIEYDSIGNLVWLDRRIGDGSGEAMVIDQNQNIYVSGCKAVKYRQDQEVVSTPTFNNSLIFSISQNYPNPFNPLTNISFNLPSRSFVSLKVFDLIGREVTTMVSEELSAGTYKYQWNAINLTSGVYFYRLQAGSFSETKKLVLLR